MFLAAKTIIGVENIPKDTPVMYAANHRSFYDIILAYATVPNQTAFISKMEIKKMPCVAQWMYFLNCLFMDRGDVKQNLQVILSAITLVKTAIPFTLHRREPEMQPIHCLNLKKAV